MNKTIDNETLLLKVESHDHRIEVLENLLNVAKDWRKQPSSWVSQRAVSTR